jgi:hypothetical protein
MRRNGYAQTAHQLDRGVVAAMRLQLSIVVLVSVLTVASARCWGYYYWCYGRSELLA